MSNSGKHIAHHLALGDFGLVVAKGDFLSKPARIEKMEVINPADADVIQKIHGFFGVGKGRYVKVSASFLPSSRFLRKAPVESPAKAKMPTFLPDLMKDCKINTEESEVAVLLPNGIDYDRNGPAPKELLFVGGLTREFTQFQESLVSWGLYPTSIEVSTLTSLAAAAKVSLAEGRKSPTLVLEIGEEVSFIYILNSGALDFSRQVPFGFKSMLPQIKSELGLADEVVARKILLANTFDFTEMAPMLLRRLVKEIQASVGFYEVQTGFATGQIVIPDLPSQFAWILAYLSRALTLDAMPVDLGHWPAVVGVEFSDELSDSTVDSVCWPLVAQLGTYE